MSIAEPAAPHSADRTSTAPPQSYVIQGRTVSLPCIVRDARSASVIYMVPSAVAQGLVGRAYEIVEMAPGLTQLVLGFVDYLDNDLGDYDEVMIFFSVRPRQGGEEGVFIYKLPVNQPFTCEAGCKIWGFPKSVEQIEVRYSEQRVTCELLMQGQRVFRLTMPRGAADAAEAPEMAMTSYTYLGGQPHALQFVSGGRGMTVTPGGDGVELELGAHPLADELRSLGLPAAPMMSAWTEHFRGSFGAAQPIGG